MVYTPAEVRALTPVRSSVEKRAPLPDLRDVFLWHAWDDRNEAAKELHDLLESGGVSVWFSEKDVVLGTSLLREIDKETRAALMPPYRRTTKRPGLEPGAVGTVASFQYLKRLGSAVQKTVAQPRALENGGNP